MRKRLLSILLSVSMMLTLLPNAMAMEIDSDGTSLLPPPEDSSSFGEWDERKENELPEASEEPELPEESEEPELRGESEELEPPEAPEEPEEIPGELVAPDFPDIVM